MRSFTIVCVSALSMLAVPASATATAASAEVFPSLRKRFEKKRAAAAAQKTAEVQVSAAPDAEEKDEKDVKDAGPVMPVQDAGAEGYPVLPAVSTMLSDASGTLKAVNAQASSLEARVVQAQMLSEAKMAKQKAAFDEKLKQQEQGSQNVISQNANIS